MATTASSQAGAPIVVSRALRSIETPFLRPATDTVRSEKDRLLKGKSLGPWSRMLYSTPVFISAMDLEAETITICNPSGSPIYIDGFTIQDAHGNHTYHFPQDTRLAPWQKIVLYTQPGSLEEEELEEARAKGSLFWLNRNGSLRNAPLLNDDGDKIYLFDLTGELVSAMEVFEDGRAELDLPELHRRKSKACASFIKGLAMLRVLATWFNLLQILHSPVMYLLGTVVCHAMDLTARALSCTCEANAVVSAEATLTLGDRVSSFTLLASLATLYHDTNGDMVDSLDDGFTVFFLSLAILEFSSFWIQSGYARLALPHTPALDSLYGIWASWFPSGVTTLIGVGNEAFLVLLYVHHPQVASRIFGSLVGPLDPTALPFGLYYVCLLCMVTNQVLVFVQLAFALTSAATLDQTLVLTQHGVPDDHHKHHHHPPTDR